VKVLLDLDGTLTDPFEGITLCIAHALVTLGRLSPPRETLRWCIGPPLRGNFAALLGTNDAALTERAVRIYRERFASVGLFENTVYPGIPEALAALRRAGHALILATSKPAVYAEKILSHFGLLGHFASVHGSELDGTRSEKPALLAHILRTESLPASAAVMVGDREHDMRGASANTVRGIGVLWGYGTREELERSGASACVAHPGELLAAVSPKGPAEAAPPA